MLIQQLCSASVQSSDAGLRLLMLPPVPHPPSCSLQVDFSQSVYHLWKQFRRFGKAGSKDVMGLDKAGEAGPGPDSRLQIKVADCP